MACANFLLKCRKLTRQVLGYQTERDNAREYGLWYG